MARFTVYHSDASPQFGDFAIERQVLARVDAELRLVQRGRAGPNWPSGSTTRTRCW